MISTLLWCVLTVQASSASLGAADPVPGFDGEVRKVMDGAFEKYRAAKTYQDALAIEVELEAADNSPALAAPDRQTLTLAFARPNQLALTTSLYTVMCDGKNLWEYIKPWEQYLVSPAPGGLDLSKLAVNRFEFTGELGHPIATLLAGKSDSPLQVFGKVLRLTEVKAEPSGGKPGRRVRGLVERTNGRNHKIEVPLEIWFEAQTGLIGEIAYDYRPMVEEAKSPDLPTPKKLVRRLRFSEARLDQGIPGDRFVFKPGPYDQKVSALRPPSIDQMQQKLIGRPAPQFSGKDLEGKDLRLDEFKGRVVLLDFWATWCGPCIMSMPTVQKVADQFADKPVSIIGVNSDQPGQEKRLVQFLKDRKITFRQFLDGRNQAAQGYYLSGIPCMVLIDKQGIVQSYHVGVAMNEEQMLTSEINQLLQGKSLFANTPAANRPH